MAAKVNNKYRIGIITYLLMIFLAAIVDLVELILGITGVGEVVNVVIDVVKLIAIPAFLVLKDVPPLSKGIVVELVISLIVGFIPFIGSILPEVLFVVWYSIHVSRKEDKANIALGIGVQHNDIKTRIKNAAKTASEGALNAKVGAKARSVKGKNVTRAKRGGTPEMIDANSQVTRSARIGDPDLKTMKRTKGRVVDTGTNSTKNSYSKETRAYNRPKGRAERMRSAKQGKIIDA